MQITKSVHAIKIPFKLQVGPGIVVERFVNVYLIFGKEIYLIDSGVASSEQMIFDYVRASGRAPEEIAMVMHTHAHPDHIGATKAIKEAIGCPVAIHQAERHWIEDTELQFKERPVPSFHSIVGGPVSVDRFLNDGDILNLDSGHTLEVIHTPGHSSGSISLLLHEEKAIISGDAVPLPGDIPIYDDAVESMNSLNKLKRLEIDYLLASWDEPREGPHAYRVIDEGLSYLQKINDVVAKLGYANNQDLMDLSKQMLRELGLPEAAVNPLVVRSYLASLRV